MRTRIPIITIALAVLAFATFFTAGASAALMLDRERLAAGELWRLWSGHLVHYSPSHLVWDVLVFVACGSFIETSNRKSFALLLVSSATAIGAVLLALLPAMRAYGGLSGLNMALLTYAGVALVRSGSMRAMGVVILSAVTIKIVGENFGFPGQLVTFSNHVRSVPLSHLAGACCGLVASVACALPERLPAARRLC